MSKHLKLTNLFLIVGLTALSVLCSSCDRTPLINLDEYTVDVQILPGFVTVDGIIASVPKARVRVSHPDAARRVMQINAYAFGERLSGGFKENETGLLELAFDELDRYDGIFNPDFETDVRITVVYGFDGSGGGPKTIYEQSLPMKYYVLVED